MVDRYVFGLSTKHPVVSVRDFNNEAFQHRSRVEKMTFRKGSANRSNTP